MSSKQMLFSFLTCVLTTVSCDTSKQVVVDNEPAIVRAKQTLDSLYSNYSVPGTQLLRENYPSNIAEYTATYLASEEQKNMPNQYSYLWPYSGTFSAVNALLKATQDTLYQSLLNKKVLVGLEEYFDTRRTPEAYASYINTAPQYLEKIVYRLIKRKSELKEYYNSIFSAFQIDNGNLVHKEDHDFLNKVMKIIDANIENPDLSVELLSNELGYSTRQFYRKLKPITEKSPTDIIREYRLTVAERLLLTKNLTIEEIMDKTGFTNRGTFYKLFSSRFGMPPRQYREQQKENVVKGSHKP